MASINNCFFYVTHPWKYDIAFQKLQYGGRKEVLNTRNFANSQFLRITFEVCDDK